MLGIGLSRRPLRTTSLNVRCIYNFNMQLSCGDSLEIKPHIVGGSRRETGDSNADIPQWVVALEEVAVPHLEEDGAVRSGRAELERLLPDWIERLMMNTSLLLFLHRIFNDFHSNIRV
jgi:hypothetical protein